MHGLLTLWHFLLRWFTPEFSTASPSAVNLLQDRNATRIPDYSGDGSRSWGARMMDADWILGRLIPWRCSAYAPRYAMASDAVRREIVGSTESLAIRYDLQSTRLRRMRRLV